MDDLPEVFILVDVFSGYVGGDNTMQLFGNVIVWCRYLGDYVAEGVAVFSDFYSVVYATRKEFTCDGFWVFFIVFIINFCY